jgi:hypothetical protein
MPFTPSHAVVALPFLRTPLVPAAVAIGAMTPDLPLFVRGLPVSYGLTHGVVWLPVTVLIAGALLLIWRCVLRPAVRELSPAWLARRLPPEWDSGAGAAARETLPISGRPPRTSARSILLLIGSLAIGVLSHIVWDLFTHEGRWGTELLPLLDELWGPLAGYKWLQHGSSVLGLAVLAIWAIRWLRRRTAQVTPPRLLPDAVRGVWWLSLPVTLATAWAIGLAVYGPLTADWTIAHLAYRVLPPACAAWGALTVALAVAIQVGRSRRQVAGTGRVAVTESEAPGRSTARSPERPAGSGTADP